MSKFRVIQERTTNNDEQQDLRGLGSSSILTKTEIVPHLVFDPKKGTESKVSELLQKYGCSTAEHTGSQHVVLSHTHQNYKANCIVLFNLSLHLVLHNWAHSLVLGETNWLHLEMHNALFDKSKHLSQNFETSNSNEKGAGNYH